MLGLKFETATSWVEVASAGLEQVLTDHAFAEQKAASNAVSIIINYSEETELVQAMSDIAIEEMEHFKMVHEFMVKKGMTLGRDQSNDYARHLQSYFPKTSDRQLALIHRLLIAALIEARSCERFTLLADALPDSPERSLIRELIPSEARHFSMFMNLAREYDDADAVEARFEEYAVAEAEIVRALPDEARVHG